MASKRLRKTLPKELPALMEAAAADGDYSSVHAALEACQIDARGGSGKGTPLMMRACTPELARWVVARGTNINATDTYGKTALHVSARARFHHKLPVAELLEMGADVHAKSSSGLTPLHFAADGAHTEAIQLLLRAGAEVEVGCNRGLSPLEYALQRMSNVGVIAFISAAKALLEAGASVTPRARDFVRRASERFEFHRDAFNKDMLPEASAAMEALCALFEVAPATARQMHDGTSPITAPEGTWQKQHAELWELLVPSKGACATVQGEVVRIAGRIRDELFRNGGMNWDGQYTAMAEAFYAHMASHEALNAASLAECEKVVKAVRRNPDSADRLAQWAVAWVRRNPVPVALAATTYER